MEKKSRILILILVICVSITVGLAIMFLNNTVSFTGTIVEINYLDRTISVLDMETGDIKVLTNIDPQILQNLRMGCEVNIYMTGRYEILNICV